MNHKAKSRIKMKHLIFIFSICLCPSAFSQKVMSLNALFTEQAALPLPRAVGLWSVEDFNFKVTIRKAGDNFYFLQYGPENNPSTFEAVFININDQLYMDLGGVLPDTIGDEDYRRSFIQCHTFYKAQFINDTLQLYELNYGWFYDHAMNDKLPVSYEWTDHAMLLTSKTHELISFFQGLDKEKNIFENRITLTKAPAHTEVNKNDNVPFYKFPEKVYQKCLPEFPQKAGWLGGDGDVSVPLNDSTTLFIFSDTYVGSKTQDQRGNGMRMISNTVAVETCLPNGKTDVHYFWNDMYSADPKPVFKSFTNRYRFWVNDAFTGNGHLYVLLSKIAPKKGGAPNDIFAFSPAGFTLAKISNPFDTPSAWKIQFIPLPDFLNPLMGIQCHAVENDFIYFFINRNDTAQLLVRKSLNSIDHPEKPFEYFALNRSWKPSMRINDMDTLIKGFRGNTVKFHPDLKLWVMVCDIKFMDNKIKIRTSPSLTGPWSGEQIIYECPEITPGSASYSRSNFSYLPRECIQNYDAKEHTMIITYDTNNTDFNEINSNPKIYTPGVIKVSLKGYVSRN